MLEVLRPPRADRGVVLVVGGPSGAGKSTLVRHLRARLPELAFSVSATTRAPRPGEEDGVHYHFLDEPTFAAWLDEGAFLEHATVYAHRYGTPRAPVEALISAGRSVLLDVDAQGSEQIRRSLPEAIHVFVAPPHLAELERRLRARGTETEEVIAGRVQGARAQLAAAGSYDYVVVNEHLATATAQFEGILLAELARTGRQQGFLRALTSG